MVVRARSRGLSVRFGLVGDERLARLVAGGDERAFATLYERYHQPLYRYCRSILRNDADAQDALQSVFASALVALRGNRRSAPMRPWLFRIAHNEAISLLRRRRDSWVGDADGLAHAAASAEDRAAERERLAILVADLQELPERLRSALVMRELSGLSHEEIAVALGTSASTAKQAIFEARAALAEVAKGRAMACEEVRRSISDGDRRVLRARRVRAHLRDCEACAAFAAAIPARGADLQALVPPLAPLAAASMLARVTAAGSAHGAGSSGGAGGMAAAAAGKVAGASVATKALLVVGVLAGTSVGLTRTLSHARRDLRTPAHTRRAVTGRSARRAGGPVSLHQARIGDGRGRGAHRPSLDGAAARSLPSANGLHTSKAASVPSPRHVAPLGAGSRPGGRHAARRVGPPARGRPGATAVKPAGPRRATGTGRVEQRARARTPQPGSGHASVPRPTHSPDAQGLVPDFHRARA
jgi:RNA polymerase sigma factor (sigma-70 family)